MTITAKHQAGVPVATILSAARFAAEAHAGQMRRLGEVPYIAHLLEVAELVAEARSHDTMLIQAALLHDVLEDTAVTPADLEMAFGAEVARLVQEMTVPDDLPKAEKWARQIRECETAAEPLRLLKLADKVSNLCEIPRFRPPVDHPQRGEGYLAFAEAVFQRCRGLSDVMDVAAEAAIGAARRSLRDAPQPEGCGKS